jgi:hypothetical protein
VARTRLAAQPGGPRPIAWRAWENYLSPLAPRITWRHGAAHPGRRSPGSGEPAGMSRERAEDPLFAERPAAPVCYTHMSHRPARADRNLAWPSRGIRSHAQRQSRPSPGIIHGCQLAYSDEREYAKPHCQSRRTAASIMP